MPRASIGRAAAIFTGAAIVTAIAGVLVEESGSELAARIGLSGAGFGATVLPAPTALPELSTGLPSVRIGDHPLAFSHIFGGEAGLIALFLLPRPGGGPAAPPPGPG